MDIEIVKDIEKLRLYKDKWQEILHDQSNENPFIELDWVISWWHYFGKHHELFVIVLKDSNTIIGFCPFMITKKWGYKELTFVGKPHASYMDIIIRNKYKEKAILLVMDFLFQLPGKYLYNFFGLFEESTSHKVINHYLHERKIPFFTYTLSCCYQNINNDFSSYIKKHFSSKTLRTMRRKEKRLYNLGELKYEKLNPQDLEEVFAIHDKRWQKKIGNSEFSKGKTKLFFGDLYKNTNNYSFSTTIDIISLNKKIIAFIYGFTCRGRYIFYRIAHDDDFYLFSPGELILREKIKECSKNDINIFDFGAGYEPYKGIWADNVANIKTIIFHNSKFIPRLIYKKNKFISDIRRTLKSNKSILNFKKYTLGKLKFKFSRGNILQNLKKAQRKGAHYLLLKIISPLYRNEECNILYGKLKKINIKNHSQTSYILEEVSINGLKLIMDITGEKASSITRRLSIRHKFFLVKRENTIICYFWVGVSVVELGNVKEKKILVKMGQ